MFQLFYDFHVKYYMNTPDGSGNRKPTLGFCKVGFLYYRFRNLAFKQYLKVN